jgi:hypothetical protein
MEGESMAASRDSQVAIDLHRPGEAFSIVVI